MLFLLLAVRDDIGFLHRDIDPVEGSMVIIVIIAEPLPSILHLEHSVFIVLSPHQVLNAILAVLDAELWRLLIFLGWNILLLLLNGLHRLI